MTNARLCQLPSVSSARGADQTSHTTVPYPSVTRMKSRGTSALPSPASSSNPIPSSMFESAQWRSSPPSEWLCPMWASTSTWWSTKSASRGSRPAKEVCFLTHMLTVPGSIASAAIGRLGKCTAVDAKSSGLTRVKSYE